MFAASYQFYGALTNQLNFARLLYATATAVGGGGCGCCGRVVASSH